MAISQYPAGSQGTPGEYGNFTRHSVENAALYKARAVGNHTTKLGACKALRERRYTPYFGVCHFNDSLFGSAAYRRARLSPPLQGACVCPAVGTNRQCLPEIATVPLGPRNDKSGAFTIVTATGTSRSCGAGRGQPGPYKAFSIPQILCTGPVQCAEVSCSQLFTRFFRTSPVQNALFFPQPHVHGRALGFQGLRDFCT